MLVVGGWDFPSSAFMSVSVTANLSVWNLHDSLFFFLLLRPTKHLFDGPILRILLDQEVKEGGEKSGPINSSSKAEKKAGPMANRLR